MGEVEKMKRREHIQIPVFYDLKTGKIDVAGMCAVFYYRLKELEAIYND